MSKSPHSGRRGAASAVRSEESAAQRQQTPVEESQLALPSYQPAQKFSGSLLQPGIVHSLQRTFGNQWVQHQLSRHSHVHASASPAIQRVWTRTGQGNQEKWHERIDNIQWYRDGDSYYFTIPPELEHLVSPLYEQHAGFPRSLAGWKAIGIIPPGIQQTGSSQLSSITSPVVSNAEPSSPTTTGEKLSYEAQVARLREAFKKEPPEGPLPAALIPLFRGHPQQLTSWGAETTSTEEDRLISENMLEYENRIEKENKRIEKKKEKLEKTEKKRLELEEKRINDELKRLKKKQEKEEKRAEKEQVKAAKRNEFMPFHDEDERKEKGVSSGKTLLSGISKGVSFIGKGYKGAKKGIKKGYHKATHDPHGEGYTTMRSEALHHWQDNEIDLALKLLNSWVKKYHVPLSVLMEFFSEEYPAVAIYFKTVLGIVTELDAPEETSDETDAVEIPKTTGIVETGKAVIGTGAWGASGVQGVTGMSQGPTAPLPEQTEYSLSSANVASGVSMAFAVQSTLTSLKTIEAAIQELDQLEMQVHTTEDPDEQKALFKKMAVLRKKITMEAGAIARADIPLAKDIASAIMQGLNAGNYTGLLTAVILPVQLWVLKKDFHEAGKMQNQLRSLTVGGHQLADTEHSDVTQVLLGAIAHRLQGKIKDHKTGIAAKIFSTGAGVAGLGVAIAGLIIGSVLTAGAVAGAVAVSGSGVVIGVKIKQFVQGHKRHVKHKVLHALIQDELGSEDPDFHVIEAAVEVLLASDPRVWAAQLHYLLEQTKGDDRQAVVQILQGIGIDRDRLQPYLHNDKQDEIKDPITQEEILLALKGKSPPKKSEAQSTTEKEDEKTN